MEYYKIIILSGLLIILIITLMVYRSYIKEINQHKFRDKFERMKGYDHNLYWDDLNQKSVFGSIYQKLFLYPMIKKHISGKLIDVGAGLGDMCAYYKNSVAADINKFSVENYKKRNIEGILIEDNRINYGNSNFDTALMDNVLEHISNPMSLLLEVKRVLKQDGKLIIGVPGIKGYESDFDHKVFYNEEKLKKLLLELEFEILDKFYSPIKSDYLDKNLSLYCLYLISQKKSILNK